MSKGRLGIAIAVSLWLLSLPAAARGPDDEAKQKARSEYIEAMKSYNLNDFAPALERFRAAYRAYPDPSFLFNIAQCYRQLDQKTEAIKSYRSYLRNSDRGINRGEVEGIIASLEKALAEEIASKRPTGTLGPGETPEAHPPPLAEKVAPLPAPVETVAAQPAEAPPRKRTGVWIAVGVVVGLVVVGAAVGLGVGLGTEKTSYPSSPVNGPVYRF